MEELSLYFKLIKQFNKYNLLLPYLKTNKVLIFFHKVLACVSLTMWFVFYIYSNKIPHLLVLNFYSSLVIESKFCIVKRGRFNFFTNKKSLCHVKQPSLYLSPLFKQVNITPNWRVLMPLRWGNNNTRKKTQSM